MGKITKNTFSRAKSNVTMQQKRTSGGAMSAPKHQEDDNDDDDDEDGGTDDDDDDDDEGEEDDDANEEEKNGDEEDDDDDADDVGEGDEDEDEDIEDADDDEDDDEDGAGEAEEEDDDEGVKTVPVGRGHAADYFAADYGDDADEESVRSKDSIRGHTDKHATRVAEEQLVAAKYAQVESVAKNVSKLVENQQLASLTAQSPELVELLVELKERVSELREKVTPLRVLVGKMMGTSEGVDDDIVDYLKVKQQMLLSYCIHVTFFLYMKVQGQSVRSHPVMRQLLELRYVMEKMRSLDGKMKHQIDRLMKQNAGMPSSSLRPNPDALVPRDEDDDDDEDDDEDEDEADEGRRKGKSGLYKAPKMAAMPYRENEADSDRREERMRRQRKKLSNSEIMDTLREEFGTAPEAASSSGLSKVNAEQRRLQEEADERRGFEEDRFVRLTMSRKEKQSIKKRSAEASRLDNFNDMGDIADFEEFMELSKGAGSSTSSRSGGAGGSAGGYGDATEGGSMRAGSKGSNGRGAEDVARALQRAVSAFAKPASSSKQAKKTTDGTGAKSASRPSISAMIDDDSDDDDFDQFQVINKSKSMKPRKGGYGEDFDSGSGGTKRRRADQDDDDSGGKSTKLASFAKTKKSFRKF